jgi:hypothetical protein
MNQGTLNNSPSSRDKNKNSGLSSDAIRLSSGQLLPEVEGRKELIWSSRRPDEWEILVYSNGTVWEACFFRWAIHHEHVIASSFEAVCQRAEQRIRTLEASRLKSTDWKLPVR